MPKFSEIGNSDAVDSVYAARAVVYVEADVDSIVFARIVGMCDAQKVAFKAPRVDGGGYNAGNYSGKLSTARPARAI